MNAYFPFSYIILGVDTPAPVVSTHPYVSAWAVSAGDKKTTTGQYSPAISEIYY